MKLRLLFIFSILLVTNTLCAQIAITGKVMDALLKEPIAGANVFIANTSLITITDKDGNFSFNNISLKKGDLIINASGYNHFVSSFTGTTNIAAALQPKAKELESVVINSYEKDGFKKWGKLYLDLFIGQTPEAERCKIANPEVLKFTYSKTTGLLTVAASDPIIIVNNSLGYKVIYTAEEFSYNTETRMLFYAGYPSFTEMEGSERKIHKWQKARNECYKGSIMHFMRSLYRNTIQAEGFTVQAAWKKMNAEKARIRREVNVRKLQQEAKEGTFTTDDLYPADSSEYYIKILNQQDSVFSFAQVQLSSDSFAFAIDSTTAGFYFDNYLLINYKKTNKVQQLAGHHMPQMYSFVKMLSPEPIEVFQNGSYYNSYNFFTLNYWAETEKMGRMLPFDFVYKE